MKKVLATVLSVLMLAALLGGCSKGAETKLLPEVAEAYEIDGATVQPLFDAFDKALADLAASAQEDDDLLAYAEAVSAAVEEFEATFSEKEELLSEKMSAAPDADRMAYLRFLLNDRSEPTSAWIDLNMERLYALTGEGSGERCAEAAFQVVNAYAQFFYGEYWITEDDLDAIQSQ